MKNILRSLSVLLALVLIAPGSYADKVKSFPGTKSTSTLKSNTAGCLPGAGFKVLDINNVRARINTGGDMWWNMEVSAYEIPKGSRKTSMFSASLWIGGVDVNQQLKLAALRYRQGPSGGGGNDFWPGPLTTDNKASVSADVCQQYDKLYPISREEVDKFVAWYNDKAAYPDYTIPASIMEWPAHGDVSAGQSFYLAPFYEQPDKADGVYNPADGDYPYYDLSNELCPINRPHGSGAVPGLESDKFILSDQVIKGDATLWWVFNDKGNIHTETEGDPIGLEIRAQAFGFSTNDVINNMTFYSYEIINRSTFTLADTYFSQWVDTDLGFPDDDFVGCDVMRGLGYCYNGKPVDGSGQYFAYGEQPPAIGVDFFQGPYMDGDGYDNPAFDGDGIAGPSFNKDCGIVALHDQIIPMTYGPTNDQKTENFRVKSEAINGVNFGNGIVDDERFGMRRFVYHNNSNSGVPQYMTDPSLAPEYYNFLRGIWKDNTKMLYGGNAHESSGAYGPECDFMFPAETDLCDWGTGGIPPNGAKHWTEVEAGNQPEDRRFMQSAGPFELKPGAVNYITVGIPWAKAPSGGPEASIALLKVVDDKCQKLFDNCFAVVNGPNAPDLTVREMENELVFFMTNRKTNDKGNNFNELYNEVDPGIITPEGVSYHWDSLYVFEGYQVFQLKNAEVSVADITDPNLARVVFQCDKKNKVGRIINYVFDEGLGANVPTEMVNGANEGIKHTFRLTEDAFTGEKLVNHKQYYYIALSYGYNNYMTYSDDPQNQLPGIVGLDGQKAPYLAGRKNIKSYTAIPHKQVGLTAAQADFGDSPAITRIQGQGNGGQILELSDATVEALLNKTPFDTANRLGTGTEDYPIVYKAQYKPGHGPVDVRVIDPLNVKKATYEITFDEMGELPEQYQAEYSNSKLTDGLWKMKNVETGQEYSADNSVISGNEQLFIDLGIAIQFNQQRFPGDTLSNGNAPDGNGVINSSMEFADSSRRWLRGLSDMDGASGSIRAFNWIRSGSFVDQNSSVDNDYRNTFSGGQTNLRNPDKDQNYEKLINGTWAPYMLTASGKAGENEDMANIPTGPGHSFFSMNACRMADLASVDIVITKDYTKWTRSVVLEMCAETELSEGGAERFDVRKGKSVNVEGKAGVISDDPFMNSNYIDSVGMGWFPGYAINVETGERLNVIFGENSWLVGDNGRDMIWNPTSRVMKPNGEKVLGGMHYIYVMGHVEDKNLSPNLPDTLQHKYECPAYDAGRHLRKHLPTTKMKVREFLMSNAMWVNIPLAQAGQEWMSNDVKVKLNVTRPYRRFYSVELKDTLAVIEDPAGGDPQYIIKTDDLNDNYPVYQFSTEGIAATDNNIDKATSELDLISVVPNPYYAYSAYDVNQLDNRVKIVNLPRKCTVSIYTSDGALIRKFTKDEDATYIDWDLKNFAGIPISGGLYLFHVDAPGIGEKVVKWFGTLRPIDLNSF